MSSSRDVIIIGGGIVGLSTAFKLAKDGARVTLLEKHQCGSGATGAAIGALWLPSPLRHNSVNSLLRLSLSEFQNFATEIEKISEIPIQYRRCGGLELISSIDGVRSAQNKAVASGTLQTPSGHAPYLELLKSDVVSAMEPNIFLPSHGALCCRLTAAVSVEQLISSLKEGCIKLGVEIKEGSKATEIIIENDLVFGAKSNGVKIHAPNVLIAGGAWSPQIAKETEVFSSVVPEKGQAILFETPRALITHIVRKKPLYLVPWGENQVAVGTTTEKNSGFDTKTTQVAVDGLIAGAVEIVPELA